MLHRTKPCLAALLAAAPLLALVASCAGPARRERFGAPASETALPVVRAEELLAAPERWDGKELVLEGEVAEVCLRKGCWMTMSSGGRELRVTFQDYGFFVPTDCAGAEVRAEGVFRITETSAELVRHYLHDAGKVEEAKAITEPQRTFSFVATGVELAR